MSEEIETVSWLDLLAWINTPEHGPYFDYDNVSIIKGPQEEKAKAQLELYRRLETLIVHAQNGNEPLFFRITAGSKAGTIMRLANPDVFVRYDRHKQYRNRPYNNGTTYPSPTQKPTLHHEVNNYSKSGNYTLDGHFYIPINDIMRFEVDGQKDVTFNRTHSANKTMKPELLIGYTGPTVHVKGKPTKTTITLKDRFNQDVDVGDVVLMGCAPWGRLITGKITRISDAKGVWIKHIGSNVDHHEKGVTSDQLLKLKDVEKVLMLEKLRAL